MLVPQFTLRAILAVTTVAAFAFVIAGLAVRGHAWAWAVTIGVACLLVAMLVQAACYCMVCLFARLGERPPGESPTPALPATVERTT